MTEELEGISAVDLKSALVSERDFYETQTSTATISEVPRAYFDEDSPVGPIELELTQHGLLVSIYYFTDWPENGVEEEAIKSTTRLIAPLLTQQKVELVDVSSEDWMSGPQDLCVRVRVKPRLRGRSVAYLAAMGQDLLRLCDALSAAQVTRDTVSQLVRGGGAHLLIGQEEGNWLDAKSEEYDLTGLEGRISLAQAVARFANAEDGGVLVIGAKTKRVPGGEVFREVAGVVPRQSDTTARYLRVLNQHLYPPPAGLQIDVINLAGDRAIILVDVPSQPEEYKPFLVHGAITRTGKVEGSFISIVQRRGEGSIPITAPMIHASLAAGRALLRGAPKAPGGRRPDV